MLNRLILLLICSGSLQACPTFTHKTCQESNKSLLPDGFYVYTELTQKALYISSIRTHNPTLIPNTLGDDPNSLMLCEDGDWLVYHSRTSDKSYVIRRDGTGKTEIPIKKQPSDTIRYPKTVGFLRSSPFGTEVYYLYDKLTVNAVIVTLSESGAVFGNERTIVKFSAADNIQFDWADGAQVKIWKDQVWGRMDRVSPYSGRPGCLTIPNNGLGTATGADIFKFSSDNNRDVGGCGFDISGDGSMVVANSGYLGPRDCVPSSLNNGIHKGFYITGFYRRSDAVVPFDDQIVSKGLSINWAPERYRWGAWDEVNFDHWSFAPNNNEYLIGSLTGSKTPNKAIWMIKWGTNTWYQLTPDQTSLIMDYPVMYFGKSPTATALSVKNSAETDPPASPNPYGYKVVTPNGGEIFKIGDTLQIQVTSATDRNADILIRFDKYTFKIPGITENFNPKTDSLFNVVIPEYFIEQSWDSHTQSVKETKISPVSNDVRIRLFDYLEQSIYDESDRPFSITAVPGSILGHPQYGSSHRTGPIRLLIVNDEGRHQDARSLGAAVYRIDGRKAGRLVQGVNGVYLLRTELRETVARR